MINNANSSNGANNKKIFFYLIVTVLIAISFLLVGLVVKKQIKTSETRGYQQGWDEAKKLFAKVCVLPTADQADIKINSFYGKIKEVKADSITVEANPIGLNSSGKKLMNVRLDESSQIKQLTLKDESEYNQELKAYQAKIGVTSQELNPTEPPPSKFKRIIVDINSLKSNQNVTVTSMTNITTKTDQVIASDILIDYAKMAN